METRLEEQMEASKKDEALVGTKVGEVDFWFMKWRSFVIAKFSMNLPLSHEKGEFHHDAVVLELRSPLMRMGMAEDRVARRERECSVG